MSDNAIIFSYDTRVNALAFWSVIGIGTLLLIAYIFFRNPKKHVSEFRWLLLAEYVVILVLLTIVFRKIPMFPDDFQNTFWASKRELTGNVSAEWLVNVLMFMPIGGLLGSVIKRNRLLISIVIGIAFSLFIETLQFLFNRGVADVEDVVCNTIGLIVGYFLCTLIYRAYGRWKKSV